MVWRETLIADDALRASLNGHSGTGRAPRRAGIRRLPDAPHQRYRVLLDARDMSSRLELNIGKDLQFIRVARWSAALLVWCYIYCRKYRHCSVSKKGKAQFVQINCQPSVTWEALI